MLFCNTRIDILTYQVPLSLPLTTAVVPVGIHIVPVVMRLAPVGLNPGSVDVNRS